jgi:shikimate dehydrogenase
MISAGTRVFALLGDPVAHSLSPLFQNAGFRAAGLDAVYLALRTSSLDLPVIMKTLVDSGGGGNITVPHKQAAMPVSARRSRRVERLGAANVFAGADGGMVLDNTDVDGILAAIDRLGAGGTDWCLFGTGGSARAVVEAASARDARIAVQSRSDDRAGPFAAWAEGLGVRLTTASACRVLINATPLGLHEADSLPADPRAFANATMVLDLTYRATGTTPWCDACRTAGMHAVDGKEVLLHQGAAAWRLWFPGLVPPIEVMRAALDGHMA